MKKTLAIFVGLALPCLLWAQPRFVPDSEIKKVGEVEFQQPRAVSFGFTNKGTEPLRLLRVVPSCGCVQVQYPHEEIAPGAHGVIQVTYDAKMLGTFYKDIEVWANDSDKPVYMAMQGCVVREVQDFSDDFPIDLGNVRLQGNYIEFDDVNKGDHPVIEFKVLNAEHTAYRPELMHLPSYLSAQYMPEDIAPGKVGTVRLTLDSDRLPMMGLNQASIYLARYLGDKVSDENEIAVSSVLLPDFSQMSGAQREMAPELTISEKDIDMGSMLGKEKMNRMVVLTNTGRSELHIHQLQVFSKAITVSVGNRVLKPGKSTKMKISVLARYLKTAKMRPRVLLISNDPAHAKEIININVQP